MMQKGFAADRLIFARVGGGRFQIGPSALAVMRQYVQDAPEKAEAGGILLGRHILGTDDIIVDDVTVPMPGDRRSRFQFFRARRWHQEAINRAWQESSGTCPTSVSGTRIQNGVLSLPSLIACAGSRSC